jgi:hypothetical protein
MRGFIIMMIFLCPSGTFNYERRMLLWQAKQKHTKAPQRDFPLPNPVRLKEGMLSAAIFLPKRQPKEKGDFAKLATLPTPMHQSLRNLFPTNNLIGG